MKQEPYSRTANFQAFWDLACKPRCASCCSGHLSYLPPLQVLESRRDKTRIQGDKGSGDPDHGPFMGSTSLTHRWRWACLAQGELLGLKLEQAGKYRRGFWAPPSPRNILKVGPPYAQGSMWVPLGLALGVERVGVNRTHTLGYNQLRNLLFPTQWVSMDLVLGLR